MKSTASNREIYKAISAASNPSQQQYFINLAKNSEQTVSRHYNGYFTCTVGACTEKFHTLKSLKEHKLSVHVY